MKRQMALARGAFRVVSHGGDLQRDNGGRANDLPPSASMGEHSPTRSLKPIQASVGI